MDLKMVANVSAGGKETDTKNVLDSAEKRSGPDSLENKGTETYCYHLTKQI